MKRHRRRSFISLIFLAIILGSCAHYLPTIPLKEYNPNSGYRYPSPEETGSQDQLFIALAFSGGGTRAAAFSYGVLKELNNTPLPGSPGKTFLDEVDVISSVSGGSFTSAYYGLFGKRIFDDFESRFLNRDIQGELFWQLFYPWNWFRLASPSFNRIDLAIELYNETIFGKQTFQSLVDKGRHPFIALNATNMTTGAQFTFTQPQFDLIGSDLSKFPIARAVAASSAFPFLLSPVSLVNNPPPKGYKLPVDIQNALKDSGINDRRYIWANNRAMYHLDKKGHPYLHLMDGGLSDNIGLQYIADGYRRTSGFLFPRKGKIKDLIVIVVNAKTDPPQDIDTKETPPRLSNVAYKTATVSMDNYAFEVIQMTKDLLSASIKAQKNIKACQKQLDKHCKSGYKLPVSGQNFNVHFINLDFHKVKDPALRKRLLSMPTSFSLKPEQVKELIQTGADLLKNSNTFRKLSAKLRRE